MPQFIKRLRLGYVMAAAVVVVVALQCAPSALAFPYHAQIGATSVYSESPIIPSFRAELARADHLDSRSPFWSSSIHRQVYLTNGGWRWRLLSLQSYQAFGFRRPLLDVIVINDTDIDRDRVENGGRIGGQRSLSGVLAHETTHIMIAHALGEIHAWLLPAWAAEGYADYVANESSLNDDDARWLRASEPNSPALAYYDYRKRVATALQRQTVAQFFASH